MASVANVRLKLDWAKQHADTVKADIQRWTDVQSKNFTAVTIGKELDDQTGCFVFKVTKFDPLPIRWSLMVGDALYNFRAALEYLAWHLVRAGTEPQPRYPRSVQFPISANQEEFAKSIKTRLPGVKPTHLTIVESHQPYHAAQQASPHPLSVLVELSNTDKHYELQGAFIRHFGEFNITFVSASDFNFERLELPDSFRDYFCLGAELAVAYGRITGPKPDVRIAFKASSSICLQNGVWVGDALDKIGATIAEIVGEIEPLL
jgi:hypothetical protein